MMVPMEAEARTYLIVAGDVTLDRLRTAPTPDGSADENALANLRAYSAHHPGRVVLVYVDARGERPLAECRSGVVNLLVPADDVAADAMHCGPLVTAAAAPAVDELAHAL